MVFGNSSVHFFFMFCRCKKKSFILIMFVFEVIILDSKYANAPLNIFIAT